MATKRPPPETEPPMEPLGQKAFACFYDSLVGKRARVQLAGDPLLEGVIRYADACVFTVQYHPKKKEGEGEQASRTRIIPWVRPLWVEVE